MPTASYQEIEVEEEEDVGSTSLDVEVVEINPPKAGTATTPNNTKTPAAVALTTKTMEPKADSKRSSNSSGSNSSGKKRKAADPAVKQSNAKKDKPTTTTTSSSSTTNKKKKKGNVKGQKTLGSFFFKATPKKPAPPSPPVSSNLDRLSPEKQEELRGIVLGTETPRPPTEDASTVEDTTPATTTPPKFDPFASNHHKENHRKEATVTIDDNPATTVTTNDLPLVSPPEQQSQDNPNATHSSMPEWKSTSAVLSPMATSTTTSKTNAKTSNVVDMTTTTALDDTDKDNKDESEPEPTPESDTPTETVETASVEEKKEMDVEETSQETKEEESKGADVTISQTQDPSSSLSQTENDATISQTDSSQMEEECKELNETTATQSSQEAGSSKTTPLSNNKRKVTPKKSGNMSSALSEEHQLLLAKYRSMKESYTAKAQASWKACHTLHQNALDYTIPQPDLNDDNPCAFPTTVLPQLLMRVEGQTQPLSVLAPSIAADLNKAYQTTGFQPSAVQEKMQVLAARKALIKTPGIFQSDNDSDLTPPSTDEQRANDERTQFLWRWEVEVMDVLPKDFATLARKSRSALKKLANHCNALTRVLAPLTEAEALLTNPAKKKNRANKLEKLATRIAQEEDKLSKLESQEEQAAAKRKRQSEQQELKDRKKEEAQRLKLQVAEEKKRAAEAEKQRKQQAAHEKKQAVAEAKRQKDEQEEKKQGAKKKQAHLMHSFFGGSSSKPKKNDSANNTTTTSSTPQASDTVDMCTATPNRNQEGDDGGSNSQDNGLTQESASSNDSTTFQAATTETTETPVSIMDHIGATSDAPSVFPMKLSQRAMELRRPRARVVERTVYVSASEDAGDFWAQHNGDEEPNYAEERTVHIRSTYKFLCFAEDVRPPYYGTWSKTSPHIRRGWPKKDPTFFDYDNDSEAEWDEEDAEIGEVCGDEEGSLADEKQQDQEKDEDDGGWLADDDEVLVDNDDDDEDDTLHLRKKLRKEKEDRTKTPLVLIGPGLGGKPFFCGSTDTDVVFTEGIDTEAATELLQSHTVVTLDGYSPSTSMTAFPQALMEESGAAASEEANGSSKVTPQKQELSAEDMKKFCTFVHNSALGSKDKMVDELRSNDMFPTMSKAQVAKTLESLATKQKDLVRGCLWQVNKTVLEAHGLSDLMDAAEEEQQAKKTDYLRRMARLVHHSTAKSKEKLATEVFHKCQDGDDKMSKAESVRLVEQLGEKIRSSAGCYYWTVKRDQQNALGLDLPQGPPPATATTME